ncbi:uncharacterized protein METZ01_LOCUS401589, partial [marine metagenome]
ADRGGRRTRRDSLLGPHEAKWRLL